jgi:hypothetical protein
MSVNIVSGDPTHIYKEFEGIFRLTFSQRFDILDILVRDVRRTERSSIRLQSDHLPSLNPSP